MSLCAKLVWVFAIGAVIGVAGKCLGLDEGPVWGWAGSLMGLVAAGVVMYRPSVRPNP